MQALRHDPATLAMFDKRHKKINKESLPDFQMPDWCRPGPRVLQDKTQLSRSMAGLHMKMQSEVLSSLRYRKLVYCSARQGPEQEQRPNHPTGSPSIGYLVVLEDVATRWGTGRHRTPSRSSGVRSGGQLQLANHGPTLGDTGKLLCVVTYADDYLHHRSLCQDPRPSSLAYKYQTSRAHVRSHLNSHRIPGTDKTQPSD